ncbi:MAG TPA: hypothetical protein VN253_29120, partial [Kofleriaceae bacterium]|nr:hypothetical protein [Kofleriaceae bacterium]
RRVSVYVAWTYPGEANREVTELDNRFSTMTEVRRVFWPKYESPEWSPLRYQQGIAGSLELFFRAWVRFQRVVQEVTGYAVPVFQRVDQAGFRLPLDERVLADADTLLIFGLDHMVTGQEAAPEEIEAVRQFLAREGTCVIIGPHHDIGHSPDLKEREMEHLHHGDPLIPHQERFGSYPRSLMKGLGVPVENHWGLHYAVIEGTNQIAPLTVAKDLDQRGWLTGVPTFNYHPHLPHYEVTTKDSKSIHVLARQPIDLTRPHPFTLAGNREFNAVVWMPPSGDRGGDILVADSTQFSTLFASDQSLERFWRNLATTP